MSRIRSDLWTTGALLLGLIAHNLLYPLSTASGWGPLVFYLFFCGLFVFGVFGLERTRVPRIAILVTAGATLAAGLLNSYAQSPATSAALYISVIGYHGVIIAVLVRFTFWAEQVFTEVVLAATCLYLLIGSVFTAVFGLIEWIQPGSFSSGVGGPVPWQDFLYFSYVTMTTLGFGDITPVGYYAQAFVTFEAVVGVLYTVVLLSRLVGLHAARPGREG